SRAWFEAGIIDPPYPESIGFVARAGYPLAGGRIVSHVEMLDMPLRWGEVILHTGAVGGVVTLPEWRRRGLASALMERLIGEMMALHERYNAGRPGTLLRPERYWRSVMVRWLEATEYPGQRNAVYTARREGRLVAYCFVFTEEDTLYLSEMAYDEAEAAAPL